MSEGTPFTKSCRKAGRREALASALGAGVAAGVGVVRFPDLLARMHAGTKPQVLGLVLLLAGEAQAAAQRGEVAIGYRLQSLANEPERRAWMDELRRHDLLIGPRFHGAQLAIQAEREGGVGAGAVRMHGAHGVAQSRAADAAGRHAVSSVGKCKIPGDHAGGNMPEKMNGAKLFARMLQAYGVTHVFFMDAVLVYHTTHMVLAVDVFNAQTKELVWARTYNSETVKSRYLAL